MPTTSLTLSAPELQQQQQPDIAMPYQSRRRKLLRGIARGIYVVAEFGFGVISLCVLLAIIAAIPGVNLLALGVMLAAEGNIARTGSFSHGFAWLKPAAHLGRLVLGSLIFLLPLGFLGSFASDAVLIDPDSAATWRLRGFTAIAACLVYLNILLAVARGGKIRDFFRPLGNWRWLRQQLRSGTYLESTAASIQDFIRRFELWKHLQLGFLGACGVLMWTFLPTTLFALADSTRGPAVLVTLLGGGLLVVVLCWLPILQAGFANEGKLQAFRKIGEARRLFRNSPALWTLVLLLGYALSLVLYLFKIVAPPRDAVWLLTLIFIAVIYPARLLAGWVYYWSSHRPRPAWYGWRWVWNLLCFAICGVYVFLLFFTRDIGAYGKLVLYEQPFLLIPSPF
ncbi:MAG: hypothetical protein R3C12_16200 [Planctomycetaceae bacterium]|nr:hypothetical protein [Planctomycetaceae bacterium]